MIYQNVVVVLTEKCNAKCDICCFSCGPDKNLVLNEEAVSNVIRQLGTNREINTISFTGGEPFLYKDMLFRLAEITHSVGKGIAIYTNAFWCKDYNDTLATMQKLKQLGLHTLLTSVDAFHQGYVKIEFMKNLLYACNELAINVKIHSSVTKTTIRETERLLQELGDAKLNTSITYGGVLYVGRAKGKLPENELFITQDKENMCCTFDNMMTILSNGDVYPCCSQAVTDVLKLGNIYESDIRSIINSLRKNKFAFTMITRGLGWFIRTIEDNNLKNLDKKFIEGCDLCYQIFSDDELVEKLRPFVEEA